ncbi:hypothetical protein WDU94_007543 [Cyamophila willieti]
MELEDYVEKLEKQKKAEKKLRKKQEKDEKVENRDQRKRLMKFTSSQKWKMSAVGKRHVWKVFKERRKNYYNYARGVVYLSCIPHGFFEEQMASYFNQFGKVTGIYMPRAPSGKIRGYAFIEFQLEVIAKIVADTMNNYLFYQRILKAKYIPPEQQKPYMFVFPFGDKRKKSVRIAAEQKRRGKQLTDAEEEAYKQKVARKLETIKNKMAALGTDYCVQVSGEAPPVSSTPPAPSSSVNREKKATKKKLKEIKKALSVKGDNQTDIESLFGDKLTKQIRKFENCGSSSNLKRPNFQSRCRKRRRESRQRLKTKSPILISPKAMKEISKRLTRAVSLTMTLPSETLLMMMGMRLLKISTAIVIMMMRMKAQPRKQSSRRVQASRKRRGRQITVRLRRRLK